jgi:tetratricopeptide (TPR) repeat protein
LWVLGRLGRGEWAAVEERLTGWFTAGELGTEALLAYLEMAGKAEHAQRLRACLEKFTEPLRCDLRLWGQAGSALVAIRNYALAVEWMRDWPERENVPPVIFINLVLALRALGRPEEAHRVSVHALQADIPDYTTPLHAVWLLFDVALTGPIEGAGTALTNMEMRALDPYHLLVYRCAEAVLLVRKMKAPQRSPAFAQAQMLLNEAVAQAPSGYDPVLALVYRATVTAIRQTVGTFGAWWWSVGQWWAPPSFARET